MAEFSFDIVCKINRQELSNALDLARKEIATRFDFKGSLAEIQLEQDKLSLQASDEMKMKQLIDMIQTKMLKRSLDLKAFQFAPLESNVSGLVKCKASIQNGLDQEQAKKITKLIKELKLKVQPRIQGDTVRVTSKNKDELQLVQKKILDAEFGFAASFENYR